MIFCSFIQDFVPPLPHVEMLLSYRSLGGSGSGVGAGAGALLCNNSPTTKEMPAERAATDNTETGSSVMDEIRTSEDRGQNQDSSDIGMRDQRYPAKAFAIMLSRNVPRPL